MRPKLVSGACFLAVFLLAVALQGYWGSAVAEDGTRYKAGVRKISHVIFASGASAITADCDYLRGRGRVEFCAPAPEADAAFSMLCAAFPLLCAAILFAFASGVTTVVSPYAAKGRAATLAGAGFASSLAAAVFTKIALPNALQVFVDPKFVFGGAAFTAAWISVALLLFAAGLSTTSTMLGHE
jgi:hypothetical protein